jgi:hypothetical protein
LLPYPELFFELHHKQEQCLLLVLEVRVNQPAATLNFEARLDLVQLRLVGVVFWCTNAA